MAHASPPNHLAREVLPNLDEIGVWIAECHNFLTARQIADGVIYKVDLINEELLTNTIKYGYRDRSNRQEDRIQCDLDLYEQHLKLSYIDHGGPFDPSCLPQSPSVDGIEDRPVGGLGLVLVHEAAQAITYMRDDGTNITTVWVGL